MTRASKRRPRAYRCRGCAVVGLLLALVCGPGPSLADQPPYPVWWSPVLELESLEDIDARLARDLWPEGTEGLPLSKSVDGVTEEVSAYNCNELDRRVAAGYEGIGSIGWAFQQSIQSHCRAVEMLRLARPAETSYLRDFVLNEAAIHVLPALVDLSPSCDYACRQWLANDRRIPLARFEPVFRVVVESDEKMEVRTLGSETDLSVLARGDFNGDGLDDLLIQAKNSATEGTGRWSDIFLLTREAPDSVLLVLEAGSDSCNDYQCDASYDDPKVLAEAAPDAAAPKTQLPITAGAIGALSGESEMQAVREGPPYEIWWNPLWRYEFTTVEDIDARLAEKFWTGQGETLLEKEGGGKRVQAVAESCTALLRMIASGYRLSAATRSHDAVVTNCKAMAMLQQAQPAETSYLRDFVLGEAALDVLPALLGLWTSPCQAAEASRYNQAGLSWQEFDTVRAARGQLPTFADGSVYRIKSHDERQLQAWALGWLVEIEIFAGGDMNGDGLDDILVIRNIHADLPYYNDNDLFVLTRKALDAVLSVVNVAEIMNEVGHCPAVPNSFDDQPIPVWWSDDLDLPDLASVDKRLRLGFMHPGNEGFEMDKWPGRPDGPLTATTCKDLFRLLDDGYDFAADYDLGLRQTMRCRTISALRQARPALTSYFRDFALSPHSLGQFSAFFGESVLRFGSCRRQLYNEARFSMSADIDGTPTDGRNLFDANDPSFRFVRVDDHEALVSTKYRGAQFKVVAGGDFNGDGLDDILLELSRWRYDREAETETTAPHRYGEQHATYILSRDDPGGVLWVVNTEELLPSKEDCKDWRAETEWAIGAE